MTSLETLVALCDLLDVIDKRTTVTSLEALVALCDLSRVGVAFSHSHADNHMDD